MRPCTKMAAFACFRGFTVIKCTLRQINEVCRPPEHATQGARGPLSTGQWAIRMFSDVVRQFNSAVSACVGESVFVMSSRSGLRTGTCDPASSFTRYKHPPLTAVASTGWVFERSTFNTG